jgi:Protein of unknown function (DUF2695)
MRPQPNRRVPATAMREKARRRAINIALARPEGARAEQFMPIADEDLQLLFDHLDRVLTTSGCDHRSRATRDFLSSKNLPADQIIQWLAEHGGFCDREVLANVEEAWSDK